MNTIKRLQHAYNVLTGKALPNALGWPERSNGSSFNWQMIDLQSFYREGYTLNSLIYSAVNYKARAVSNVPFRAYEGNPDNPVRLLPSHPLSRILTRPNNFQSFRDLLMAAEISLNISGNVYIAMDRDTPNQFPRRLVHLDPQKVRIIPSDDVQELRGYVYVPEGRSVEEGVPILAHDMIHIKLPNPLDKLEGMGYGMSPISSIAQSADADNKVTKFLYTLFKRGTLIGGALKFKDLLSEQQAGRFKARWREQYGGVDNWATEIAILDNGAEYQRMTPTFDELGFSAIDERSETRILGPFGVAPILIGSRIGLYRATYSNYEQARRATWEDTLMWEINMFNDELQYRLSNEGDGSFVQYDLSDVPALQKNIPPLVTAAKDLIGSGVPPRIAFKTVGLNIEDYPGIDTVYLPMGMNPVAVDTPDNPYLLDEPSEQDPADVAGVVSDPNNAPKSKKKDSSDVLTLEGVNIATGSTETLKTPLEIEIDPIRAEHYKAVNRIAKKWEDEFVVSADNAFQSDLDNMLALLTEEKKRSKARKSNFDWNAYELDIYNYLNTVGKENWRETFVPLLEGVMTEQAEQMIASFGLQFDVPNIAALQWFDSYTLQFAQEINETTKRGVGDLIQQAKYEGWGVTQMQDKLGLMFEQWRTGSTDPEEWDWYDERMPQHRLETIARTESMRASNYGSHNLLDEWGVKQKEWLATNDKRLRDTHYEAWLNYGGKDKAIPMNQPFIVGGQNLMYPGDPAGGSEGINCRCTLIPSIASSLENTPPAEKP